MFPALELLKDRRGVLVAGAGGGFDVYCGLPIYFALRRLGVPVHLGSLTFTLLPLVSMAEEPLPGLLGVTAASTCSSYYFPEGQLARWLKERRGEDVTIWCFSKTGVRPLAEKYRYLIDRLGLDALVLVDGGVDSLLRGDETELGTPVEDMTSLAAAGTLSLPLKILACTALGAEKADDISHSQVFEAIAALSAGGDLLGGTLLTREMPEGREFIEAGLHGIENTRPRGSVIVSSMISALEGRFGDYHAMERTRGSELWINPLMPLYWFFRMEGVVRRNLYLPRLLETMEIGQVLSAIKGFRLDHMPRPPVAIPL